MNVDDIASLATGEHTRGSSLQSVDAGHIPILSEKLDSLSYADLKGQSWNNLDPLSSNAERPAVLLDSLCRHQT